MIFMPADRQEARSAGMTPNSNPWRSEVVGELIGIGSILGELSAMRPFRIFRNDIPDPADPGESVTRARRMRTSRHLIGLWFDTHAKRLQGAAITSRGCGRWGEFQPGTGMTWSFEGSLAQELSRLQDQSALGEIEAATFGYDFAQWVACCCQELVDRLGPLDDELLAICFHDDGWCVLDFDGRPLFVPSLDAARLAELSGLSVISQLRQADLSAGGLGGPLEPLALWFLLADRSARTAASSRVLLKLDSPAGLYYLPASDGLDAEHPSIEFKSLELWKALKKTLACEVNSGGRSIGTLAVQGRHDSELTESLRKISSDIEDCFIRRTPANTDARLAEALDLFQGTHADIARSGVAWLMGEACRMVRVERAADPAVDQVIVSGGEAEDGFLLKQLETSLPQVQIRSIREWGWDWATLNSTLAGVLGFLHIDQQPATLPWITQADVPRLHGILAPGRPSAWRRLLKEMADYRPPPMKLREAV